jgi:hypothetical protein
LHLAYRRDLPGKLSAEAFLDVFNLLNQRTVLTQDQTYSADKVMPISGGSTADLKNLATSDRNGNPVPAIKNPNFLMPTSYQAPIAGRLGVRVFF